MYNTSHAVFYRRWPHPSVADGEAPLPAVEPYRIQHTASGSLPHAISPPATVPVRLGTTRLPSVSSMPTFDDAKVPEIENDIDELSEGLFEMEMEDTLAEQEIYRYRL